MALAAAARSSLSCTCLRTEEARSGFSGSWRLLRQSCLTGPAWEAVRSGWPRPCTAAGAVLAPWDEATELKSVRERGAAFPLNDVLEAQQFDRSLMNEIFEVAKAMEDVDKFSSEAQQLKGFLMATLFYEPSTRTRLSFESAMKRLGGEVLTTENAREFSSAAKGETLEGRRLSDQCIVEIAIWKNWSICYAQVMSIVLLLPRLLLLNSSCLWCRHNPDSGRILGYHRAAAFRKWRGQKSGRGGRNPCHQRRRRARAASHTGRLS